MDEAAHYGQMDFNLPHDVIKLPSKGIFYKPRKESIKETIRRILKESFS